MLPVFVDDPSKEGVYEAVMDNAEDFFLYDMVVGRRDARNQETADTFVDLVPFARAGVHFVDGKVGSGVKSVAIDGAIIAGSAGVGHLLRGGATALRTGGRGAFITVVRNNADDMVRAMNPSTWKVWHPRTKCSPRIASDLPDFEAFGPTQGFPCVYDPKSGALISKPSTSIRPLPEGHVIVHGGHSMLSQELVALGAKGSQLRACTILKEDGVYRLGWTSRSVNGVNFGERVLPLKLRPSVIDAVKTQTRLPIK
jgi:hypothetical protein